MRQSVTRAKQLSPLVGLWALKLIASAPAALATNRRASNEPLGALVVDTPRATRWPSSSIFQLQVCPLTFVSTSASTSIRPSSALALILTAEPAVQLPLTPPPPWDASAGTVRVCHDVGRHGQSILPVRQTL